MLLAGLSGPFCLLLLPVALLQLYHDDNRARRYRAGLVVATALVQGGFLLASGDTRSHAALGADPLLLARIVATQIVGAGFLGLNEMSDLAQRPLWQSPALPLAVALVAAALVAVAICRGPWLLRYAFLYAGLTFSATLLVPQISLTEPQWPLMALVCGAGNRYYLFPMLALIAALCALAADHAWPLRLVGCVLLMLLPIGIVHDWRQPALVPSRFAEKAREFAAAPSGTRVELPIRPAGKVMILVKRAN